MNGEDEEHSQRTESTSNVLETFLFLMETEYGQRVGFEGKM